MNKISAVIERFRKEGYKITPQRIAIFRTLENNHSHPSADGIYKTIKEDFPSISLTTVYKTLETLAELGEIKEVLISKERVFYDPNVDLHHHFICSKCGRIYDIPADGVATADVPSDNGTKFNITHFTVNFFGSCSKCKKAA